MCQCVSVCVGGVRRSVRSVCVGVFGRPVHVSVCVGVFGLCMCRCQCMMCDVYVTSSGRHCVAGAPLRGGGATAWWGRHCVAEAPLRDGGATA